LTENLKETPKRKSDKERVQDFQRNLYQKAKQEKEYRFYVLYDKIHLPHFLREAYKKVRANGGSAGVDGMTFEKIEESGREEFLERIREELKTFSYKPQAVKRVMIPKANGEFRPLGIPTIKDRVVQMSCKLVIEPIFEADFEDNSYGFRPERSSADAMKAIKKNLQEGKTEVYDADVSKYFDTIPHDKLLITVAQRISDKNVLHLIKLWLTAPIEEDGKLSGGKKNKVGTPQGGVISPLLANIYLHLLDRIVNKTGSVYNQAGVTIVRYADDFVLMGRKITGEVVSKTKEILERMGLHLNEQKTKKRQAKSEAFDFLGFQIRYDKDIYTGNKRYWNIVPSPKSQKKIRGIIRDFLDERRHWNGDSLAKGLNKKLCGWLNYYTISGVSYPAMAKRKLQWYLTDKLYHFYQRKSQRKSRLCGKSPYSVLVKKHNLIEPTKYRPKTLVNA